MARPFDLLLPESGLARRLGARPCVIGRSASADVVLADESVSTRHAAVWSDGTLVWVQDLGSRNGIFVDGERVTGVVPVQLGAVMRIGRTEVRVRVGEGEVPASTGALLIEDVASGHGTAFVGDRVDLGDGPGARLRIPGAGDVALIRVGPDEVLLARDDDMVLLPLGQPFEVGDRTLVVRPAPEGVKATADLVPVERRYRLEATLEPVPTARVVDHDSGRTLEIDAENRAVLLWVLGARGGDWVPEAEVLTAVWGRAAGATPKNLRVLVCRLRKDLREAHLDPWWLEHRAGHLRVRLDEIVTT